MRGGQPVPVVSLSPKPRVAEGLGVALWARDALLQTLYVMGYVFSSRVQSACLIGALLLLPGCGVRVPPGPPAGPTLINCKDLPPAPVREPVLPPFVPAYPCELENATNRIDDCTVYASDTLSYPCSRSESVQEHVIASEDDRLVIQRDFHFSAGCWRGTTVDVRSLRVCDRTTGESVVLAPDILSDAVSSPDGTGLAFVSAESPWERTAPHIYYVRIDGRNLVQLDTQPFPQERVVGARILGWVGEGEWLEVSLWDGREEGHHGYRLRPDGSGVFEEVP